MFLASTLPTFSRATSLVSSFISQYRVRRYLYLRARRRAFNIEHPMSKLLQTISDDDKFRKDVSKYLLELNSQLKTFDFFKAAQSKKRLSALESGQFFADCIAAMEQVFAPHIQAYSAMRWMYYLRRMPNPVFSGDLHSTVANNRALAEIYAQRSERVEEARLGPEGFKFPLDDGTLRHAARFSAFVVIMNDLQVDFRFASKGCEYAFGSERATKSCPWGTKSASLLTFKAKSPADAISLPRRVDSDEIVAAARIYDQRHNVRSTFLGNALMRAGLADIADAKNKTPDYMTIREAIWSLSEEALVSLQELLEGHPQADMVKEGMKALVRFGATGIELDSLFDLYRLPVMAAVNIDDGAVLNLITLLLGGRLLESRRFAAVRVMEVGYFVVDRDEWNGLADKEYASVCDRIRTALPQLNAPATFELFSAACHAYRGSAWPIVHGNPVRTTSNYVCIDMWAASMGFITALQFPKVQGQVANERATWFEDVVQELIDTTPWAAAEVHSLRQKALTLGGKVLTDIDAIGTRGRDLLIVSCKSIPYTMEYDQGAYKAIRNAETTVVDAVAHWKGIVEILDATRVGDNYNLSGFDRIIGVVCTPFAVYTKSAEALSTTTGSLRWASSVEELAHFLRPDTEQLDE